MQEAEESLSWEVYWHLTLDCFRRCHSGSGRPLLGGDTKPARGTHHLQEAPTTRATSASVLELSARRNGCLPCRSFSPRCVGYV